MAKPWAVSATASGVGAVADCAAGRKRETRRDRRWRALGRRTRRWAKNSTPRTLAYSRPMTILRLILLANALIAVLCTLVLGARRGAGAELRHLELGEQRQRL